MKLLDNIVARIVIAIIGFFLVLAALAGFKVPEPEAWISGLIYIAVAVWFVAGWPIS